MFCKGTTMSRPYHVSEALDLESIGSSNGRERSGRNQKRAAMVEQPADSRNTQVQAAASPPACGSPSR